MTLKRLDDLMEGLKRDVLLLYFKCTDGNIPDESIKSHLAWFNTNQIMVEELTDFKNNRDYGDICYYVDFENADDPRIALYSQQFENEKFLSLKPEEYQMYLYNWVSWYINGGNLHFEGPTDENTDNG
jgi:hypothetical protein